MSKQERGKDGQFAAKSNELRQVRSIRVTDVVWEKLGRLAEEQGMTRADLIENLVEQDQSSLPQGGITLQHINDAAARVLNDPKITRNGKDRGSVRRALEALLNHLF